MRQEDNEKDTMGVRFTRRSDGLREDSRSNGMPQRTEDNSPTQVVATAAHYRHFCRAGPHVHVWAHTRTSHRILATTHEPRRESEERHRKEFQISQAIFHFSPREGILALNSFLEGLTM